ncbi:MAG: peptide-methionine (S)-S-oxide reductase MsrA [Acidimicrobiales bacterium]
MFGRDSTFFRKPHDLVDPALALPGREEAIRPQRAHLVLGTSMLDPFGEQAERAIVGMGCFWGAERLFWKLPGVLTTAVGYAGGTTPNPTYQEVCGGRTGHAEVVLVVFDPTQCSYSQILKTFWEGHDPTQGMRQGNDVGTQYRSILLTTTSAQATEAAQARERFQAALTDAGRGTISTGIEAAGSFFYAEEYHQQYLAANPNGYCGLGGTGVTCPIPGAGTTA